MRTNRLEAFSDGVLAVVITVMVLELDIPNGASWHALGDSAQGFLTYALSFVYIGIYWNNHHHMFQVVEQVSGAVLWANLDLLFWLSLFPFTTAWIDQTGFARNPMVVYGVVLLLAALGYYALQQTIFRAKGGSRLREALGRDFKGKASPFFYLIGIGLAFVTSWLAMVPYVAVAVMWLVPDRRVERYLASQRDVIASGRNSNREA
ncbi:MAG TPA: TMEM175 family protein [Nocardioidaceae bacterium]|nr:TMEM175 family protein [Nocardioidaceae bacterium]